MLLNMLQMWQSLYEVSFGSILLPFCTSIAMISVWGEFWQHSIVFFHIHCACIQYITAAIALVCNTSPSWSCCSSVGNHFSNPTVLVCNTSPSWSCCLSVGNPFSNITWPKLLLKHWKSWKVCLYTIHHQVEALEIHFPKTIHQYIVQLKLLLS